MDSKPLDLDNLLRELNQFDPRNENEMEKKMKATVELNEQNFEEQVLRADKPVVVDFWAEWCGPCRILGPSLEEIASDHRDRALIGKVNVHDNPALAARYEIQSIPTLLYFAGGEIRDRSVGLVSKKEIDRRLTVLTQTQAD